MYSAIVTVVYYKVVVLQMGMDGPDISWEFCSLIIKQLYDE